jgi:hypothetical protein
MISSILQGSCFFKFLTFFIVCVLISIFLVFTTSQQTEYLNRDVENVKECLDMM